MSYQCVHLHPPSHVTYYPGATPVSLKLVFDPESGKILGAQAAGKDGVDKRIDVLATAIAAGMTVEQLAQLELCYAPPFGAAKDPVNLAGMAAANIRRGLVRVAHWNEIPSLQEQGATILDVRDEKEREQTGSIPGSLFVPLNDLREKLDELPKDKTMVVHCASGQRSYYASRILLQNGFEDVRNLSGSWKTYAASSH